MMWLLSGIALLIFAWLAYQHDRRALALIPALSPLYLIRFELGSLPTTLLELFVLIALVRWLTTHPWTRNILKKSDAWWLALLALVVLMGTLAAIDTASALGIAKAYYIEPALLFLALRDRLTKEDFQFGLQALGLTAFLLGLFGVFQWATGLSLPIPYDFERRITSVFPYPNAYGLFVTPLLVCFGIIGWTEKKKEFMALAVFLFATLLLSETEAGIVAALGSLGLFGILKAERPMWKAGIATVGALGLLLAFTLTPIREKLLLHDSSGLVRRSQWQETALLLKNHPIAGVGFNGYPEALIPYHTALQYEIFQYPHNLILNAWVEAGLINIAFLLFLAATMIRALITEKGQLETATAFALASMLIHGLVDVPFYKNDLAILTVFLFAIMLNTTYASTPRSSETPHNT